MSTSTGIRQKSDAIVFGYDDDDFLTSISRDGVQKELVYNLNGTLDTLTLEAGNQRIQKTFVYANERLTGVHMEITQL